MPALDGADLDRLRATPPVTCTGCGRQTYKSYCRQDDVFFWLGHALLCESGESDNGHRDHRIL